MISSVCLQLQANVRCDRADALLYLLLQSPVKLVETSSDSTLLIFFGLWYTHVCQFWSSGSRVYSQLQLYMQYHLVSIAHSPRTWAFPMRELAWPLQWQAEVSRISLLLANCARLCTHDSMCLYFTKRLGGTQ